MASSHPLRKDSVGKVETGGKYPCGTDWVKLIEGVTFGSIPDAVANQFNCPLAENVKS